MVSFDIFKTCGYKSYFLKKSEIYFPNTISEYMIKFHPNFYINNICQKYLKIYNEILT